MRKESKSYLDLYLDNVTVPKKRGVYFTEVHENAIIKFNDQSLELTEKERFDLFEKYIEPGFRKIISGVLEMPMFHHLGKMNREELIDNTFYRLVEKMNKFTPGRIGKNGQPVKAYSYFSTIAKNHIMEQKLRHEKILRHKADVESSIDLSVLSEDTLEKMSNYDKQDVHFDSYEGLFKETSSKILFEIEKVLHNEEIKDKPDDDLIKIGYILKYLIKKWDKVEFMKKNEFMRILALYAGLKQQQVSLLFKKFKLAVLQNLNPSLINKKISIKVFEEDEEDFSEENIKEEDEVLDMSETDEIENHFRYEINSMEEFDIEMEILANTQRKNEWKKKNSQ